MDAHLGISLVNADCRRAPLPYSVPLSSRLAYRSIYLFNFNFNQGHFEAWPYGATREKGGGVKAKLGKRTGRGRSRRETQQRARETAERGPYLAPVFPKDTEDDHCNSMRPHAISVPGNSISPIWSQRLLWSTNAIVIGVTVVEFDRTTPPPSRALPTNLQIYATQLGNYR